MKIEETLKVLYKSYFGEPNEDFLTSLDNMIMYLSLIQDLNELKLKESKIVNENFVVKYLGSNEYNYSSEYMFCISKNSVSLKKFETFKFDGVMSIYSFKNNKFNGVVETRMHDEIQIKDNHFYVNETKYKYRSDDLNDRMVQISLIEKELNKSPKYDYNKVKKVQYEH